MKVEAVANTEFVHGDITAHAGHVVKHRNGELIEESTARALEKKGLVRIRTSALRAMHDQSMQQGKAPDDGRGQPSSASQAAPVSPTTTSTSSEGGKRKGRQPKGA